MKRILTNKKGVTLLEGVIALGLLALVAGGAFAVLLSASRQTTQPTIREEMALAVEKAHDQLKILAMYADTSEVNNNLAGVAGYLPGALYAEGKAGLCDKEENPLSTTFPDIHHIECLLPRVCDENQSEFTYKVFNNGQVLSFEEDTAELETPSAGTSFGPYQIRFSIMCNGYSL